MELAAIVDSSAPSEGLAAELKTLHFKDLDSCLRQVKLDGLIIATPTKCHVAHGLAAVRAGVPMLVEKPISNDLESAMQLVQAAEAADVPLLVGHHRRHSPLIQEASRIVQSGQLGQIVAVNGCCLFRKPPHYFDAPNSWRKEPGGGVVLINLIHVMDDLRTVAGEIMSVQAITSSGVRGFPVEDSGAVLLRFASGALGTLVFSDATVTPWSWEMTSGENPEFPKTKEFCYFVAGTRGSLTIPRLNVWVHQGESWVTPIIPVCNTAAMGDPLQLQIRHFGQVIRREVSPLLDGRGGSRTLEATLAIKKAADTGQTVFLS